MVASVNVFHRVSISCFILFGIFSFFIHFIILRSIFFHLQHKFMEILFEAFIEFVSFEFFMNLQTTKLSKFETTQNTKCRQALTSFAHPRTYVLACRHYSIHFMKQNIFEKCFTNLSAATTTTTKQKNGKSEQERKGENKIKYRNRKTKNFYTIFHFVYFS